MVQFDGLLQFVDVWDISGTFRKCLVEVEGKVRPAGKREICSRVDRVS